MYFIIHCDHEGGEVSTHTSRLISGSGASVFNCFTGAILGLSGPLHGLAN